MSATASTDREFEVGAVAHVTFRVRCEKFGFGEEVFLVSTDGKQVRRSSFFVTVALLSCCCMHWKDAHMLSFFALICSYVHGPCGPMGVRFVRPDYPHDCIS